MVKKQKVIGKLLYGDIKEMTKLELKYIKDNVEYIYEVLDSTPISRDVLCRRYGIEKDKLEWLDKNREQFMATIKKEMNVAKNVQGVITSQEIVDELYKEKVTVIGMLRDGARPKTIFEELGIMPNPNAFNRFIRKVKSEGYSVEKIKYALV